MRLAPPTSLPHLAALALVLAGCGEPELPALSAPPPGLALPEWTWPPGAGIARSGHAISPESLRVVLDAGGRLVRCGNEDLSGLTEVDAWLRFQEHVKTAAATMKQVRGTPDGMVLFVVDARAPYEVVARAANLVCRRARIWNLGVAVRDPAQGSWTRVRVFGDAHASELPEDPERATLEVLPQAAPLPRLRFERTEEEFELGTPEATHALDSLATPPALRGAPGTSWGTFLRACHAVHPRGYFLWGSDSFLPDS